MFREQLEGFKEGSPKRKMGNSPGLRRWLCAALRRLRRREGAERRTKDAVEPQSRIGRAISLKRSLPQSTKTGATIPRRNRTSNHRFSRPWQPSRCTILRSCGDCDTGREELAHVLSSSSATATRALHLSSRAKVPPSLETSPTPGSPKGLTLGTQPSLRDPWPSRTACHCGSRR